MKARVFVTLKPGVLDVQGQAVMKTLQRMGYGEVGDVRIGKYVELAVAGDASQDRLEEMCKRLLANTVIENYRIETTQTED